MNKTITNEAVRLVIGKHQMNGFAGLSDGDLFGHVNGGVWKLRHSGNDWTLRPIENTLGTALEGFESVPDYTTFIQLVNVAYDNATLAA